MVLTLPSLSYCRSPVLMRSNYLQCLPRGPGWDGGLRERDVPFPWLCCPCRHTPRLKHVHFLSLKAPCLSLQKPDHLFNYFPIFLFFCNIWVGSCSQLTIHDGLLVDYSGALLLIYLLKTTFTDSRQIQKKQHFWRRKENLGTRSQENVCAQNTYSYKWPEEHVRGRQEIWLWSLSIFNYSINCHKNLKCIHITLIKTYFKTANYTQAKCVCPPPPVGSPHGIHYHEKPMKPLLESSRT